MDGGDQLPDKLERTRSFVQTGGQVVGGVSGAAVGLFAGPLVAAGAGVVLGKALAWVGAELHDRVLAPRQSARAAGALAVAALVVNERLEAGDLPRGDGFFEPGSEGRADAEELLEGALFTAASAYEERKVPFIGRLWANLAFDSSVTASHANYLLRLADRLTYRQLVLLLFFAEAASGTYEAIQHHWASGGNPSPAVVAETEDLSGQRLIGQRREGGSVDPLPAWDRSRLEKTALMPVGTTLYRLMQLSEIPGSDLDAVVAEFRGT